MGSPATGLAKGNTIPISANLNANTDFINKTAPDASNPNGSNPKAYLTIVFFNERFEYVSEGSTALRVTQAGDGAAPLVIPNVKAPKNGYAYVYLSNESNEPVYFDDFKVTDTRGRIIEENHYYSFGLRIAGISSVKFGDVYEGFLKNNYQYQGDYSEMDEDIGWNDFALRNYDSQVGRWIQQDPFNQFPSPYAGMGNNPVNNIDPSGGWAATGLFEGMSQAGIVATTTLGGAIIGGAIDALSGGNGLTGLLMGAGAGLASNFSTGLVGALAAPSVELISGGFKQNYLGANLDATFKVKNVKASGLQIIQTLHGPDELPDIKTFSLPHHYGKFSKTVNGVRIGGFVDGGINSITHPPVDYNNPYYINETLSNGTMFKYKDYVHWQKTRGTIRVIDVPSLVKGEANFETIIVAKNYRGTKKDKIIGHFSWGTIDLLGTKNIDFDKHKGGIDLKLDGNISELSREIIKFDYPNYKFYQ